MIYTWTVKKSNKLKKLYPTTLNSDLCKILNVPAAALKSKAARMGLIKLKEFRDLPKKCVESRINMSEFIKLFPTTINSDLAKRYNTNKAAIKNIASKYRLRKSSDSTNNGRFKKGNVPWCAGTKGLLKANPGSFKKGHVPHNTLYNGTVTIRKTNDFAFYKWYRIGKSKWRLYQRVIWERAYGPIPKDHNIVFIDGDTLNCSIHNLMLISNEELMERNTGSVALTDSYIANILSLKEKEFRIELLNRPDIIEIKRESLKLKRAINEQGKNRA